MEEDKFQFKTGGRTAGQTLYNEVKLLNYINKLELNKMYGITKAGKGITLLTKSEVIPKSKVKEKIEELEKEINEEHNAGDFTKIFEHEQDLQLCINVLEELLES